MNPNNNQPNSPKKPQPKEKEMMDSMVHNLGLYARNCGQKMFAITTYDAGAASDEIKIGITTNMTPSMLAAVLAVNSTNEPYFTELFAHLKNWFNDVDNGTDD